MTSFELFFGAMLLRCALAVGFLLTAEHLLRHRLGARFRRILWFGCLLLMMVPQLNSPISPFRLDLSAWRMNATAPAVNNVPSAPASAVDTVRKNLSPSRLTNSALSRKTYYVRRKLEPLAVLLLPLPALLLLFRRYLKCRRVIRRLPPVTDAEIIRCWKRILAECGPLPRPVILLDSTQANLGPTLFGCFTQKLLLPVKSLNQLTPQELQLLLEHEHHHSRGYDPLLNLFTLILCAVGWYNPFLQIARRRLRSSCELECDRKLLARHPHAIRAYGNLLLRFAAARPSGSPVTVGLTESPRELAYRIRTMTSTPNFNGSASAGWLAAGLIAAALVSPICLVAVNARANPNRASKIETAKPILPYLTLNAQYGTPADESILLAWQLEYPDGFPFAQSTLQVEIGDRRLDAVLRDRPRFLLLRQITQSAKPPVYQIETANQPPQRLPAAEPRENPSSSVRLHPAADGKAVYTLPPRVGEALAFYLHVEGITGSGHQRSRTH